MPPTVHARYEPMSASVNTGIAGSRKTWCEVDITPLAPVTSNTRYDRHARNGWPRRQNGDRRLASERKGRHTERGDTRLHERASGHPHDRDSGATRRRIAVASRLAIICA